MGKATESMVSEGGEIGSAVGGKTKGQPYHAHALPKKDKLRLAYSEVVYGCNYNGVGGPRVGFYMGLEMAGSDRHVLHVRRPFVLRTKWHTSVLGRTLGFSSVSSPKLRVCSRENIVRCSGRTRKQRISLHEGRWAHVILKLKRKRVLGVKQLAITTMSGH
jgi:hypothetical protein